MDHPPFEFDEVQDHQDDPLCYLYMLVCATIDAADTTSRSDLSSDASRTARSVFRNLIRARDQLQTPVAARLASLKSASTN